MRHFVVIGLGSIGRRHALNLAHLDPAARFTFIRQNAIVDGFCTRLGAAVVADLAEVDEEVDLAVLSTPSADHIRLLPKLIELGWPLLIEKPIVTELDDCTTIEQLLARSSPATRIAAFNLRHLPSIELVKRSVDSGEIGSLARASLSAGQWLPDWRPGTDYSVGYSASAARGGGVELDLAHEFDLARWFFGELDLVSAQAGRHSGLGLEANDTAVALLTPSNGRGPITTVALDYVSRQAVRSYDVVGNLGSIRWNLDGTLEITTSHDRNSLSLDPTDFDMSSSYVHMIRKTLHAIASGDTSEVQTLSDGIASSRLAIAARNLGSRR